MNIDIGSVLRRLRVEVKHLTLHELSDAIDNAISPSALSRMENEGRSLSPAHLKVLADFHRTTISDIFREAEGGAPTNPALSGARLVPCLKWEDLPHWSQPEKRDELRRQRPTLPALPPVSPAAFALQVQGDSMQSEGGFCFPEGFTILVEPDIQPKHKDFVIASHSGGQSMLRQLIIEGPESYLRPINRNYKSAILDDNFTIVGVVVEQSWRINRDNP